jgi:hypothetical protein
MDARLQKGWKLGTMYRAQPGHPSFQRDGFAQNIVR